MKITDIEIGMRVHADDCAPEDADSGIVLDIDHARPDGVLVGWDTCQQSWQSAESLEPGPLP